jgi:hypothetical protein
LKSDNALKKVVCELDRRGLKVSEISQITGCDYNTVLRNMPPPEKKSRSPSAPWRRIEKSVASGEELEHLKVRPYNGLYQDEFQKARELAAKGYTAPEIAKAVGLPVVNVYSWISEHGLLVGYPPSTGQRGARGQEAKPKKPRRKYDREIEEARALAASGLTAQQIAAKLVVRVGLIYAWKDRYGVELTNKRQYHTEERIAKARELAASGMTVPKIADELGVTASGVRYWIKTGRLEAPPAKQGMKRKDG